MGGKEVNAASVAPFVEGTHREIFAPSLHEVNKLLATAPAGGLQCQPHWWGCSAALQVAAKLLVTLAESPKAEGLRQVSHISELEHLEAFCVCSEAHLKARELFSVV